MIVSKDINPKRDFYYLGAKVLEILSSSEKSEIEFFDIFAKLKATEQISVNLLALTLDWLYLVGAIENNNKGTMVKCF